MRLIDVDKLELKHYVQRVSDKVIGYNGTQPKYANYDILAYDIANAPTVKAITIEWIEKQIKKALSVDSVNLFYVGSLKHLIKEWEKENDKGSE